MTRIKGFEFLLNVEELDHDDLDSADYAQERLEDKAKEIVQLIQMLKANVSESQQRTYVVAHLEHLIGDLIGMLARYKQLQSRT